MESVHYIYHFQLASHNKAETQYWGQIYYINFPYDNF